MASMDLRIGQRLDHEHQDMQPGRSQRIDVRAGEPEKKWFRSDRCFTLDSKWFFSTREGIDVGPYKTRLEAQAEGRRLTRILGKLSAPEEQRQAIYDFVRRPLGPYKMR